MVNKEDLVEVLDIEGTDTIEEFEHNQAPAGSRVEMLSVECSQCGIEGTTTNSQYDFNSMKQEEFGTEIPFVCESCFNPDQMVAVNNLKPDERQELRD